MNNNDFTKLVKKIYQFSWNELQTVQVNNNKC